MFKNIKTRLLISLCTFFTLFSCLEDQGNYNYNEVNDITINTIQEDYSILRFDKLNIVPELELSLDPNESGNYSYKWVAHEERNSLIIEEVLTELSTERDLNETIYLKTGKYKVYYTVIDLNTEIEYQHSFHLEVRNSIYEGWLVLNEVNGGSRLDMISLIDDEYIVKEDVLSAPTSIALEGTPDFVYTYSLNLDTYGIYVSTSENGTTRIEEDSFDWNKAYNISNEFVSSQPEKLKVDNILSSGPARALTVVDGDVYWYYLMWSKNYSVPVNTIDGEFFKVSPMMASGASFTMFYDITNKRFVRCRYGYMYTMPDGNLTSYTTGKDLVFMDSNNFGNSWGSTVFSILKNDSDNKNYMLVFNSNNSLQSHYKEINAPDFDQATNYAVSPDFGYLFYSVGSKVYQYDVNIETTKLMLDKGTEDISLLKFQSFFVNGNLRYKELGSQLIVASYDPAGEEGTNGTMELYSVPPVNGQIELEASYTGLGKIKSISYRER